MASYRDVTGAGGGLPSEAITNREFNQVRRGYDPVEVKRYLAELADDLARLRARSDELTAELNEARQTVATPDVSEEAIVAAVGEEMAATLRSAHAAAAEMKNRAAADAERVVSEAQARADAIEAVARARATEVNAEADARRAKVEAEADGRISSAVAEAEGRIAQARREAETTVAAARGAASTEAAQIVSQARTDAESVRQQAEQERRLTVEGAQAIRERILGDLARRRRVATVQIEQLRAGRERLLESYAVVRRTLEEVNDELQRADSEARAAADEVGRRLGEEEAAETAGEPTDGAVAAEARAGGAAADATSPQPAPPGTDPGDTELADAGSSDSGPPETASDEPDPSEGEVSVTDSGAAGPVTGPDDGTDAATGSGNGSGDDDGPGDGPGPGGGAGGSGDGGDVTFVGVEPAGGSGTDGGPAPDGGPGSGPTASTGTPPGSAAAPVGSVDTLPAAATGGDATGPTADGAGRDHVRLLRSDGPDASAARSARPGPGHLRVLAGGGNAVPVEPEEDHELSAMADAAPAGLELVGDAPEGDGVAAGPAASPDRVGTIFDRIRAERERSVAEARDVLTDAAATTADTPSETGPDIPSETGPDTLSETGLDAVTNGPEAGPASVPAPAGASALSARRVDDVGSGMARSDADESELQRRDADLDELVAALTRRMKRALQDEHNDLLDRLRGRRSGTAEIDAVLGQAEAQAERYRTVALSFVEGAVTAGARFAAAGDGTPGAPGPVDDTLVATVTATALETLVTAVVGPLRRRVGSVLSERGGDANEILVDALASVYRETRAHRVEPLVADALSAAHAEAVWRVAPDGARLRWIAEDAAGPCPDCDDNVLAGSVVKGEAFPTGQLHPPAHEGCRCLLVITGE